MKPAFKDISAVKTGTGLGFRNRNPIVGGLVQFLNWWCLVHLPALQFLDSMIDSSLNLSAITRSHYTVVERKARFEHWEGDANLFVVNNCLLP